MEVAMGNADNGAPGGFAGERRVDVHQHDFLRQVNDAMKAATGVRYLEVMNSIHPGGEAWKDAYDRSVAPLAFVAETVADFGLARVGDLHSAEGARQHNLVKAAMCEFSLGNADWVRGDKGELYNEVDGGVGVMRPVKTSDSDRHGFGIEFREGARLDPLKRGLSVQGKRTETHAALDMSEALTEYEKAHRVEAGYRL